MLMTIYTMSWNLVMNRKTTRRIFVSPSRVLTGTSRLNLRTSLAWRGIRERSWFPLPNLWKFLMRSRRNQPYT